MTYSWQQEAGLDWLTCFWRRFWLALTCFSRRGQFWQWAILARILWPSRASRFCQGCSSNCPGYYLLSARNIISIYCRHWSHLAPSGWSILTLLSQEFLNIYIVTISQYWHCHHFYPKSFPSKWGLVLTALKNCSALRWCIGGLLVQNCWCIGGLLVPSAMCNRPKEADYTNTIYLAGDYYH